jgi:formate dehydrogenase subunit delta
MNPLKLIKMANQIGVFFGAMPDRGQAVADAAQHIRRMWEPRMRHDLFVYIDQHGTDGLSDIMREVVTTRRKELEPPPPN